MNIFAWPVLSQFVWVEVSELTGRPGSRHLCGIGKQADIWHTADRGLSPGLAGVPSQMSFHLNLRSLVYSLSDALDLVGVDELHHGKRVASMAVDIARTAGFDEDELDDLFIASLLHDCGVSTTKTFKKLNTELEWEGAADHCERGYELLKTCDLLSKYADVVRYHHTPWEELGQMGLDRKVIDHANCIYLADRVDALLSQHAGYQMVGVRDTIRDTIIGMSDRHFSSVLVMAFVDASVHGSGWIFPGTACKDRCLTGCVAVIADRWISTPFARSLKCFLPSWIPRVASPVIIPVV